MRRYLQGTLDYACGVYAVINALGCTHGIDLQRARLIFQESLLAFSEHPLLWKAFVRNETDHYWVVRHLLDVWCSSGPWKLTQRRPFAGQGGCKEGGGPDLARTRLYLPEKEPPRGPASPAAAAKEAAAVWASLNEWLGQSAGRGRAVILRFHRFLPGLEDPVVSHWTAAARLEGNSLMLHDASSEKHALFVLERGALCPAGDERAPVRIAPESLILLGRHGG